MKKTTKAPTITTVIKRDGRAVEFSKAKVASAISKAGAATKEFDEKEAKRLAGIVVGILDRVHVALNGSAAQLSVEQVQDTVEQVLMAAGHFSTAKAYILYRAERAEIRETEAAIGVENDLDLNLNQLKVIERRYLRHDESGKAIETPAQMFTRVAKTLASVEKKQKKQWQDRFYEVMSSFEFLPAGRTLNNAGTAQNQLANCFVLPVEDSMEGIFDAVKWMALVHQRGGGTGFDFTNLRPRGDVVSKSSGGFATGPVSFMKVFDVATRQVMQGGKLRGANMGILGVSHPDILEFITCKTEEGEISNFNISLGATDEFMKAVEKDSAFALRNPRDGTVVQEISARLLMDHVVSLAWRTGDPGMIFWDEINRNNPLLDSVGPIRATNPCGEQPLHPFDACNLGSINLSAFVRDPMSWISSKSKNGSKSADKPSVDWARLIEVTKIAVRALDNVIDACTYPLPQIDQTVKQNRRIGLGVMGWADMLVKMGVPYNSEDAVALAEKVMKTIQEASWDASEELASDKGVFPMWKESWFAQGWNPITGKKTAALKKNPRKVRNVAISTIAPTGTISMAANTSSGIEPLFALSYRKNVVDQEGLVYVNPLFEQALQRAVPDQEEYNNVVEEISRSGSASHSKDVPKQLRSVFVTSHDIDWQWHVKVQAAFQKHTDNAVSKTINFPADASIEEIRGAYMLAWSLGCKGITVYRDSSRGGQVLQVGSGLKPKQGSIGATGASTTVEIENSKKSVIKQAKKEHVPLIQSKIRAVPLHQRDDFLRISKNEISQTTIATADDAVNCPDCGDDIIKQEGCNLCPSCGWSKCTL